MAKLSLKNYTEGLYRNQIWKITDVDKFHPKFDFENKGFKKITWINFRASKLEKTESSKCILCGLIFKLAKKLQNFKQIIHFKVVLETRNVCNTLFLWIYLKL